MKYIKPLYETRLNDRVVSAQDLVNSEEFADLYEFKGIYGELFGSIGKGFDMGIFGSPGSGKSTFLLRFARYLALNFAEEKSKVLYISSEEFGSVTLIQKLKELTKRNKKPINKDKLVLPKYLFFGKGLTDLTEYGFVILDSLTDLNLDLVDYKELKKIYPNTSFISALQSTKAGDYRGGKDFEHEFEIFSEIEDGIITVTKNRYGTYGKVDIFTDKVIKNDKSDKR